MTDKPTPTDAELKAMWQLHAADIGGIFYYARAVLAKWGTPAGAGEPFGYFHQLLNHEGKGNGVWLGAAERKVVEQAHTPGETSEEIVALYTTPQPAPATQQAVDNSRFDYKTAADFLSGKTVSDEALRKFVAASRGAHDARAALHAKMLSLQGELASREAEIALLKRSLLDAEDAAPQPSPTAQSADSVPAVSDLPPLPAPDLRDVGTKPQEIKEFLKGYATEYARTAIAASAPADSVQEDASCAWSNDELTAIYNEANGITVKNPPITTERIFAAMRRVAQIAARAAQKEGEKT